MWNLEPELVIAITALVSGVVAAFASWRTNRQQARRDEVNLLREEVSRLQTQYTAQGLKVDAAYCLVEDLTIYGAYLQAILTRNSIAYLTFEAWRVERDHIHDSIVKTVAQQLSTTPPPPPPEKKENNP